MSDHDPLLDKLEKVIKGEHHYHLEAYRFVMDALHYCVSKLDKQRHVTGKELLEGIRQYAIDQYGPLARTVLNHWGLHLSDDFGHIVFDLVEAGILRKQAEDNLQDFHNVYDFKEAFDAPYTFPEDIDTETP